MISVVITRGLWSRVPGVRKKNLLTPTLVGHVCTPPCEGAYDEQTNSDEGKQNDSCTFRVEHR